MARALLVAALFDRRAKRVGEPGAVAQEARRHHVEQRPQFAEMVFQRRAGQRETLARGQFADQARRRRVRVLDGLRFVEDQQRSSFAPGARPCRARSADRWSTRDRCRRWQSNRALRSSPCSVSTFRSARIFPPPAANWPSGSSARSTSAGRSSRPSAFSAAISASACTVLPSPMSSARMPPRPDFAQKTQPGQAIGLIGAQFGDEIFRRRAARQAADLFQFAPHVAQRFAAAKDDAGFARGVFERRDRRRVAARQPQARRRDRTGPAAQDSSWIAWMIGIRRECGHGQAASIRERQIERIVIVFEWADSRRRRKRARRSACRSGRSDRRARHR